LLNIHCIWHRSQKTLDLVQLRNGFAYTIERAIGQFIASDPVIAVDFYDMQADFDDQKLNLLGTSMLPELPNQR